MMLPFLMNAMSKPNSRLTRIMSSVGIPLMVGVGLFFAVFLNAAGFREISTVLLGTIIILGSLPLLFRMIKNMRQGVFGVDIIAMLAIIGSVLLQEFIAGAVILLMLSGGEALEAYALSRASRQLTHLLSRAPKKAHRRTVKGVEEISVRDVRAGDVLVVAAGDVVPVDGVVEEGVAMLDESVLTGEAMPVEKTKFMAVSSGTVVVGQAFVMIAKSTSEQSAYGRIVALVKQASESRPPIVRLADQYAVFFNAVTIVFAVGAWLISGLPERALAVLVVATPCPLILAVPIAVMSAISAAAKRGVVVKDGGALERLARVKAFLFDKTGTVTFGVPEVIGVELISGTGRKGAGFTEEAVLRYAASLEQLSGHVVASAIRGEARKRNVVLPYPEDVHEEIGRGVRGHVESNAVVVGSVEYLHEQGVEVGSDIRNIFEKRREDGAMPIAVAVDGVVVGMVVLGDAVRDGAKKVVQDLRDAGVVHIALVTGDKKKTAMRIAGMLGITEVVAECAPEKKVDEVKRLRAISPPVAMVGDGINDAPALAAADVGIAMTSRGETAATDAADIVITVDSVERSRDVHAIARHMLRVATQGVLFGIGASIVLMVFAAMGYIPPVYGALFQEAIDILVILNALRVFRR